MTMKKYFKKITNKNNINNYYIFTFSTCLLPKEPFPGRLFQEGFSRKDFPERLLPEGFSRKDSMKAFPDIIFHEGFSRKYFPGMNAFPGIPHEECNAALCVSQL